MSEPIESILRLKIAQLENKILIYESFMAEMPKIEKISETTNEIKNKFKKVVKVWSAHNNKNG